MATDSTLADGYIQARIWRANPGRNHRLVVLHSMESSEMGGTARSCGLYFAGPDAGGSAHYGVDPEATIQYVREADQAAGAPGANQDGDHIELAGRASQTRQQWLDDNSMKIIKRGAELARDIGSRRGIPARWLTDEQVADRNTKGYTDHRTLTRVMGTSGGHSDPGADFPIDVFMNLVNLSTPPTQEENDVNKPAVLLRDPKTTTIYTCPNNGEDGVAIALKSLEAVEQAKFFGAVDKTNIDGTVLLGLMAKFSA